MAKDTNLIAHDIARDITIHTVNSVLRVVRGIALRRASVYAEVENLSVTDIAKERANEGREAMIWMITQIQKLFKKEGDDIGVDYGNICAIQAILDSRLNEGQAPVPVPDQAGSLGDAQDLLPGSSDISTPGRA